MDPRAQASSALGWASVACWILVCSPQIIENYQLQSGEGLSVLFVVTWLFADITGLAGAIIAGLLPTVIIVAVYYALCSVILLFQIYWYRHRRQRHPHNDAERMVPMLPMQLSKEEARPQRNNTSAWGARAPEYVGGLFLVVVFGLAAWWWNSGGEDGTSGEGLPDPQAEIVVDVSSQVLGWLSTISYVGAPIPQILKNRQTKCAGLSLTIFMFAVLGNITYVLSICALSLERNHLIANAPWLAGSALTVLLDFVVLGQFFYYRSEEAPSLEEQKRPLLAVD